MGHMWQDKLQNYQNRAARVISGASYETRSTDILESLGWETLEKRHLQNKAVLMYKILNDHSAPNLKQLQKLLYHYSRPARVKKKLCLALGH